MKAANKSKFCETHYLEERTMVEIANIKQQLEEIVSEMGIPIMSGGSIKDYLCAISVGLIQFVCERTKKNSYRSLTADRIRIHARQRHVPGNSQVHRCGRDRQKPVRCSPAPCLR